MRWIVKIKHSEYPVIRRTYLALQDVPRKEYEFGAKQAVGRQLLVNVTPTLTDSEREIFQLDEYELTELKKDPLKAGDVKPFEVMAQQSRGIKRVGILRMDVDNLGTIFSRGIDSKNYTLSRMATLSFTFSLFFEGWLEQIAKEINQQGQIFADRLGVDDKSGLVYSIYAGGDDLFMVGAWDLMPLLAERVSQDLSRYAGEHPGIHVSGGLVLIPQKYPLYQAAEDAEQAEKQAKGERPDGQAKDALAFLEQTLPWSRFTETKTWHDKLIHLVEERNVARSLLQTLRELFILFDEDRKDQKKRGAKKIKAYWGPGQWRTAYKLARLAERYKDDTRTEIHEIRTSLHLDNFQNIERIGLAARWAALLTRKMDGK